jgi:hypothetical protein
VTDITTTFVQPVPPPPSLSTTIKDHITNEDLTGKIIRFNRTVHDTVTITGSSGAPSGKITYTLYNNINCGIDPDSPSSSIIRRDEVDIDPNSGFIPPSSPFVLDSSGSVSYQAYYNSDNANYRSTLSPCEPLTFSSLSTSIMDDMTGDRYPSVIMPFGRVVHDTATIDTGGSRMALGIPEPTGNIVFQRYNSTNCTGDFIGESGSGVSPGGSVFPILRSSSINLTYSPTVSYKAFYSGDRNYDSLVSLCESIRVLPPQITTTIKDQKNMTINVGSTVPIGTIIHDTAQIFGITGTPPGTIAKGTVTYQRFFHSDPFTDPHSFCNGDHIDEPPVTINSTGGIPNSADFTLTAPGIVSYKAVYDGWGASSACEYIRVNPSP